MMRKITFLHTSPIVLLMLPLLSGCGGSSSISNGYPSSPSVVGNPTGPGVNGGSTMATLTDGRTYVYAVSGTVTKDYLDSSNKKQTMSGAITNATLTRVVSDAAGVLGAPGFQLTDTLTFTIQGSTPTVETTTSYITQGQDGSISYAGANLYTMLTVPQGAVPLSPGTFGTSLNLSSGTTQIAFPNDPTIVISISPPAGTTGADAIYDFIPGAGSVETSFTCLGQETVPTTTSVPYTAWKTQSTMVSNYSVNGFYQVIQQNIIPVGFVLQTDQTVTAIEDWIPSLGAPARRHVVLSQNQQVCTAYNYTAGTYTTAPSITYTYAPNLSKKETLDMVLISEH
jgi:hypothetical protein